VDDLGAILVIAIFYTDQIHWAYLGLSALMVAILSTFNFFKLKKHIFYIIPGLFLWYFMHHSGIHATIAGVLLAFTIPTNISTTEISPLEKLEQKLHLPVNFLIMPIFALANTNITFKSGMVDGLFTNFGYGIILGLFLGKLIGITFFSWIFIKLKISSLPDQSSWTHIMGAALLARIGFTLSIFIALLSFKGHPEIQDEAKFAVLVASVISGFAIYVRDFARYNLLYGSIGSIILVMVWVNINIILILLGNELNIAIKKVRVEKMMADEIAANADQFNPEILPDLEEADDSKTITVQ
jgi:Na+:H+ antiporter, NhaA family